LTEEAGSRHRVSLSGQESPAVTKEDFSVVQFANGGFGIEGAWTALGGC
jgi:hypothetical protein